MSTFTIQHEGKEIFVEISPCSWMHKGYGLQLKLSLEKGASNAASLFDLDKSVPADSLESDVLLERAKEQAQRYLSEHGAAPLEEAAKKWTEAFTVAMKELQAQEARNMVLDMRRFTKAIKDGFTHRFRGRIHPSAGSDYEVEAFFAGALSQQDIAKILKKSVVKDDYRTDKLTDLIQQLQRRIEGEDEAPSSGVNDRPRG